MEALVNFFFLLKDANAHLKKGIVQTEFLCYYIFKLGKINGMNKISQ